MELSKYVGKKVRIDITNGFYYSGLILSADSDSITLRDKNNKMVTLSIKSILFIREVEE